MENQHRKIIGYPELSQKEIDLMNEIRARGSEIGDLIERLIHAQNTELVRVGHDSKHGAIDDFDYIKGIEAATEALRWTRIGKDQIQQGIMALVRSVARPTSF